MYRSTLPRHARASEPGWAHPYATHLFSPFFYADGEEDDQNEDEGEGDGVEDKDGEDDAGTGNDDAEPDDDGAEALGDKGKAALDRMKAKLKTERQQRRAAEAERDQLKTKPDEADPERIRAEATAAATAKANARIVRSEVRAAATGKLADPRDALAFIDLAQFEVDDDGQVDEDEVGEAIEQLLRDKPHLAAATAKRFQGTGDGGARKGSGGAKQLGKNDLKGMTPEQIDAAHAKGQLRDYLNE